jgi:hypothetical protein
MFQDERYFKLNFTENIPTVVVMIAGTNPADGMNMPVCFTISNDHNEHIYPLNIVILIGT